jgi:hypothetical protein
VQVAQTIHAAGESSPGNLPNNTYAVALGVSDELELLALEDVLLREGVAHHSIREPDAPYNGALMAIGLVPQERSLTLRKLLGGLRLLR